VIVQRAIEQAGIPTIIIAALPPVVRQNGSPRAVAPRVPMELMLVSLITQKCKEYS